MGNVTLSLGNVTLDLEQRHLLQVTGCWSHTGTLAVKVDAPRRPHGWWPFGHGSFLASSSGLRFSLSRRSLS